MPAKRQAASSASSTATIGFEVKAELRMQKEKGNQYRLENPRGWKADGRMGKKNGILLLHSSFLLTALPSPANGSMSTNRSGDIRRALIEADLVDCMVALPGQLFYSTRIPFCLWLVLKNYHASKCLAASELELAFAA